MDNLFKDKIKYNLFSQIQKDLINLPPNPEEDQINEIIQKIPSDSLNSKDDLKTIIQLFSSYAFNILIFHRRNAIKLLEKIMPQIKAHLQNESTFFWKVFDNFLYMKLWMYQEGLISINNIIQAINLDETRKLIEYFYPEVIEKEPEAYLKEYKFQLPRIYSDEEIIEFKEKRRKHFQWIRESGDFHDPLYLEIEQDQLRLSIKQDNIEKFQTIISHSNISIDSKIEENVCERYWDISDFSLLEFAVQFNAIKIFKFLVMNDAEINTELVHWVIQQENYEMIHYVREQLKIEFFRYSLIPAINFWKMDILDFIIDNFF